MSEVQTAVAKIQVSGLFDEVERGESLVLTRHGREIATISPAVEFRRSEVAETLRELTEFRRKRGRVTVDEILSWRDEGRR